MRGDFHAALAGVGIATILTLSGVHFGAAVLGTSAGASLGAALNMVRPQDPVFSRLPKKQFQAPGQEMAVPPLGSIHALIFWGEPVRIHHKNWKI